MALARPGRRAGGGDHGPDRRHGRGHRGPLDPRGAGRRRGDDPVGRRGLHARLRGRADHRRPPRRPVRTAAHVPPRAHRVRRGVGAVRSRDLAGNADRLPRRAGPARRDADTPGLRHPQGHVPARRPRQGVRRVRPDDRPRRGRGADPRGRAHRLGRGGPGLAHDLPDQRAARARGAGPGRGGAAGVARRGRAAPRPGRDGAGVDRPRAAGVPARGGPRAGLARVDVRHAGRGGRAARRLRRAPGAAQPGGPGTAGRARAVPTADVHRGDGGGAGVVRGHHRARAGAGPLPPARAGLHAAAGRAHAGAVGVGDRRGLGAVGCGAGRPPRPHGAADRRGRGGGGARRRAADRHHGSAR